MGTETTRFRQRVEPGERISRSAFGLGHNWSGARVVIGIIMVPVYDKQLQIGSEKEGESSPMIASENIVIGQPAVNKDRFPVRCYLFDFFRRKLLMVSHRRRSNIFSTGWYDGSTSIGWDNRILFINACEIHVCLDITPLPSHYNLQILSKSSSSILEDDAHHQCLICLRNALRFSTGNPSALVDPRIFPSEFEAVFSHFSRSSHLRDLIAHRLPLLIGEPAIDDSCNKDAKINSEDNPPKPIIGYPVLFFGLGIGAVGFLVIGEVIGPGIVGRFPRPFGFAALAVAWVTIWQGLFLCFH